MARIRFAPERLDLDALYDGVIDVVPATQATLALADAVFRRIEAAFTPLDPLFARAQLSNEEFFLRLSGPRRGVSADAEVNALAAKAIASLGWDLAAIAFDRPRCRAVPSDGHLVAEAAPAYGIHRDTWYANPSAQINCWIPLHDVDVNEAFGFWPDWFGRPIDNTSDQFDLADWKSEGGFQAYDRPLATRQHHPTPRVPLDIERALQLGLRRGHVLRFSAAHLHGTLPHSSGRTRYSVELRVVDVADHRAGRGAKNVDGEARGSTFDDYTRPL
jgi:hypothetical protein